MQRPTPTNPHKSRIPTRQLPTKKTTKNMEKPSLHVPPPSQNNIYHKSQSQLANASNPTQTTNPHANIPPPPPYNANPQQWITTLAELAKTTKTQARKITTKYTQLCIKKVISKYRKLYDKSPK